MRRQIPLLRGLAILAVVANHTTGTGLGALFFWAHPSRHGAPPYLEEYGTLSYYSLSVIRQLALFSVPAFLFISGYFIAYAARGKQATVSWKVVRTRILALLWPYLLWSAVAYAWQLLQGALLKGSQGYSFPEFLLRLVTGNVMEAYFFVVLLLQFYLLAPFIARLAKQKSRTLLGIALALQLSLSGIWYAHMFGIVLPQSLRFALESPITLLARWALFFPLGVVCGLQASRIDQWLSRNKWFLLGGAVVLGILSVVETLALNYLQTEILDRSLRIYLATHELKLSTLAYAVVATFAILSFDRKSNRLTSLIESAGSRSYGIYLIHPIALQALAALLYFAAPWLASQQWLLQPVLFFCGVGLPTLLMAAVYKSPGKKFYRYAFS